MIPKKLHFIWVGDESKQPDNCIDTWRTLNSGWDVKIWGNASLRARPWINAPHMGEMSRRELNRVADMMRWEILYAEGGVVLDADSICLRPLDDDLLDCDAFACWESEMKTALAPMSTDAQDAAAIEAMHDPYFVQKVAVSSEFAGINKLDVFRSLCSHETML